MIARRDVDGRRISPTSIKILSRLEIGKVDLAPAVEFGVGCALLRVISFVDGEGGEGGA